MIPEGYCEHSCETCEEAGPEYENGCGYLDTLGALARIAYPSVKWQTQLGPETTQISLEWLFDLTREEATALLSSLTP